MAVTAALLADEVLPERPLRQWVLSLPHALRFLLATDPDALTLVLGVVCRTVSRHLIVKAGLTRATGVTVLRPVVAPESSDLQQRVEQIAGRIARALERRGLVERDLDLENVWLAATGPAQAAGAGG